MRLRAPPRIRAGALTRSARTAGPTGDCAVLQVTGEVDVSTAPMLREQIRELAAKGAVHLIADLSQVDFLDPTGLGALVGGVKRLREAGGSLSLVIRTPRILRIFQITGLTKALAIQRSAADAITADPHWQQTAESDAGSVREWCEQHAWPNTQPSRHQPSAQPQHHARYVPPEQPHLRA